MLSQEKVRRDIARGHILRITRIVLNLDQSEMAVLMETSKSYLSLLENAKRSVNDNVWNRYLEYFRVDRQVFEKVESEVIEILFNEDVNMIRVAYLVVGMLRTTKCAA